MSTLLHELFPWRGGPDGSEAWHVHNAFRCDECDGSGQVCVGHAPMRAYLPAGYQGTLLMGGTVEEYGECPECDGTGICADWRDLADDYPEAVALVAAEM